MPSNKPLIIVDQFGNALNARKPVTSGYRSLDTMAYGTRIRDLPIFTFQTIQLMLVDNTVKLGLAMRLAPLVNLEFAYKQGQEWVPGIKADREDVADFVERMLKKMWTLDILKLIQAQIWGWAAVEVMYRVNPTTKFLEYHSMISRHPRDCFALEQGGNMVGVEFHGVGKSGVARLGTPTKALFHAFEPPDGTFYGQSIMKGAYSPWADKWMNGGALDIRRLFMHADAYGGRKMRYPPGETEITPGQTVPNRDIAADILATLKTGGVVPLPAEFDQHGNALWDLESVETPSQPTHILNYPKDLDVEILRGLIIPDDYLISGDTGAWAGKRVPMQAFFTPLTLEAYSLVATVTPMLQYLVLLNFGKAVDFEIGVKPLDIQAMEQQKGGAPPVGAQPENDMPGGFGEFDGSEQGGDPNAQPGGQEPFQLGFNIEAAFGGGLVRAESVVEAVEKQAAFKSNGQKSYSSTQFNLPAELANKIQAWASKTIQIDDLDAKGIETESHVTVKYGIHSDSPEQISHLMKRVGPIAVRLGNLGVFPGPERDVLYIAVESQALRNLNQLICDAVPHTDTQPYYIPHVTVAYLKPGTADQYTFDFDCDLRSSRPPVQFQPFQGDICGFDSLIFSNTDKKRTIIPLAGPVMFGLDGSDRIIASRIPMVHV